MLLRKTSFRFGLCLTCCLSLAIPAVAQNTFDPFAPNAVAPTEPMAAPTAPTPIAPKLPARAMPKPAPVVEAAPAPMVQTPPPVAPEPVIAKPITPEPAPSVPVIAKAPAPNTDPSFWNKLNSIFDDKDKPEEKPKTGLKKTAKSEPAKETLKPVQSEPTAVKAPAPTPYVIQAPAPYAVPANPQNTNPFAASSVAPSLPTDAPRAVLQPTIVKQTVEPKVFVDPALSPKPMTLVHETPSVQKPAPIVEQVAAPEISNEPSFFDTLSNIFSSPKSTEALKEEPTVKMVQDPEPIIKEPVVDVVEETKTLETVETTPLETPTSPVQEPAPIVEQAAAPKTTNEPSFFDTLSNIFSSPKSTEALNEEPKVETVQDPEPISEELVVDVIEETKTIETIAPKNIQKTTEPFATQAVAPTTPVDTPSMPEPFENVEAIKADPEEPSSNLFDKVDELFKRDETPTPQAEDMKPEAIEIAPKPVVEPVQTPVIETLKTEPEGPGLFDRITNFFDNAITRDEPAEKPSQAIVEDPPSVEEKTTEQAVPEKEIKPAPTPKPIDPRLVKAELGLGKLIKLGQGDDDLSKKAKCFTKNRGTVSFCLNPTTWPKVIAKYFDVSSHLYKGAQGIVQLDGNIATRLFTLFNKDGFEDLVKYYENKLGPATAHFVRKTRTIRKGTVGNPVYVWQKENIDEGLVEIMELRSINDMRGSLPDLEHGTMRVYFEGAREIFERTSELDFMDLR